MKNIVKLIAAFIIVIVFSGCQPNDDYVSFGQAFSYLTGHGAYLIIAILSTALAGYLVYYTFKVAKEFNPLILFVALVILLTAWLAAPLEITANTTKEAAARGNWVR